MLKRFVLWEYPRGGWQYDIMVGVIVGFIFLTPRGWFRDQPRIPTTRSIAILPAEQEIVSFIDKEHLAGVSESDRVPRAAEVLRTASGNSKLSVTRVEPILSSEGELQGFIVFARR